jgi:hypothetical protein
MGSADTRTDSTNFKVRKKKKKKKKTHFVFGKEQRKWTNTNVQTLCKPYQSNYFCAQQSSNGWLGFRYFCLHLSHTAYVYKLWPVSSHALVTISELYHTNCYTRASESAKADKISSNQRNELLQFICFGTISNFPGFISRDEGEQELLRNFTADRIFVSVSSNFPLPTKQHFLS